MARQRDIQSADAFAPGSQKTSKKVTPTFVKYYLLAYNIVSSVGWAYLFILTLIHIFNLDGNSSNFPGFAAQTASSTLSKLFSTVPFLKKTVPRLVPLPLETRLPLSLRPIYRRSLTTFGRVGPTVALVQTLAVLEILHVLLGWVRSTLQTTLMQVSSRLLIVWGITEQFPEVRSSPLYTSMVLSWSVTEIIRYSFYASNLLGYEPPVLLYLRYTTFYVLYPLGAGSEAFLIYSSLPKSPTTWSTMEYFRFLMILIWPPALYIMYTHMMRQRRKVFGAIHNLKTSKGAKTK